MRVRLRSSFGCERLVQVLLLLLSCCKFTNQTNRSQTSISQLEVKLPTNQVESLLSNYEHPTIKRFKRRSLAGNPSSLVPEFGAPIGNVSAVVGRDVRLVCTVKNLGQHQVAWLKEETKTILSIDTNIIITNYRIFLIPDEEARKWVLHIKDVQESDRGLYRCQVNTNPMISTLGHLEVVVPASLIEAESSQVVEVVEGQNASLQCKASGHPRPTISWRREDGAPIKLTGSGLQLREEIDGFRGEAPSASDKDETYGGDLESEQLRKRATAFEEQQPQVKPSLSQLNDVRADRLALTHVDRTMAGLYVCSASNGIPSQVSRQIPLYVKFPPNVTIVQRSSVLVALGEQLELECLIEAFPKPTSYWSGRQALGSATSGRGVTSHRPRWLLHTGAAFEQPMKTFANNGLQLSPQGGSSSGGSRMLMAPQLLSSARLHPLNQVHRRASGSNHEQERSLDPIRLTRVRTVLKSDDTSGSSDAHLQRQQHEQSQVASVTVKQSAVNAYTYRLKLTIEHVRPSDLGDYVCVSSNPMGASSARVQVRVKTGELLAENLQTESASGGELREQFQRDSLAESTPLANSQVWANQLHQVGPAPLLDESGHEHVARRPNYARQTNRVYDENYLQAIRNRQASAAGSPASSSHSQALGKLQQKLKMTSHGDQVRNSAAAAQVISLLMPFLLLVALCWAWKPHDSWRPQAGACIPPRSEPRPAPVAQAKFQRL